MFKKILPILILLFIALPVMGASIFFPYQGGTGTGTTPTNGQLLIGKTDGTYNVGTLTAGTGMIINEADGAITLISTGAGSGGAGQWTTTTDELAIHPIDTSDVVLIGVNSTSTTGNILEVVGDSLFDGTIAVGTMDVIQFGSSVNQIKRDSFKSNNNLTLQAGTSDDDIMFNLGSTEYMRLDSNGFFGINTTTPDYELDVDGDARANNFYGNGSYLTGIEILKGNTITVAKSGGDYDVIQDAIDASTSGDTILIYDGTYTENVTTKTGGMTTLVGVGTMGSVVIQADTGTVLTVPSAMMSMAFIKNLKLKSDTTGANSSKLVYAEGTMTSFNDVSFDYDIENGYTEEIIDLEAGSFIFTGCKFDYDSTGTSGGMSNFVSATSSVQFQVMQGFGTMSLASTADTDGVRLIQDTSTGANIIRDLDFKGEATSASFGGHMAFMHTTNTDNPEVIGNKIVLTTPSGVGTSEGHAYHLSGTGGGNVHSTSNRVNVTGFVTNGFAEVDATESFTSHFDDIVAADGVAGDGDYDYVNSPSDGNLQMSGFLIRKVIDIVADYDETEAWEFGILNLDSTTITDVTVTIKPSAFATAPSGAFRTFINSSDTYNMVIDPNGVSFGGSTNDRVIYPGGYITVEKIGTRAVITGSSNTSFNIDLDDLANKSFHMDFSSSTSVTVSGNDITQVQEGINYWTGTPSSGGRAKYGLTTQNGLNTALWNTANSPISFGNNDINNNSAGRGMTIIAVVKPSNTGDAIMSKYYDATPQREWRFYTSNITIYSALSAAGQEAIVNYSSNYGEWEILQIEWTPDGGATAYKNGFLMGDSSYTVASIPSGSANLLMGASDLTGADYWGEIGEVIALSDTMTESEREAITSKLGAKWDIDVAIFSSGAVSPFGRNDDTSTIRPLIDNDNLDIGTGNITAGDAYFSGNTTTTGETYLATTTWEFNGGTNTGSIESIHFDPGSIPYLAGVEKSIIMDVFGLKGFGYIWNVDPSEDPFFAFGSYDADKIAYMEYNTTTHSFYFTGVAPGGGDTIEDPFNDFQIVTEELTLQASTTDLMISYKNDGLNSNYANLTFSSTTDELSWWGASKYNFYNDMYVNGNSTTTGQAVLGWDTKIGNNPSGRYIAFEDVDMGMFGTMSTINPHGSSGGIADDGIMGMYGGVILIENDDDDDDSPGIIFASRDAGTTGNAAFMSYSTTSKIMNFDNANQYRFDNDLYVESNTTTTGSMDASQYCISGANCITSWAGGSGGSSAWEEIWAGAITPTTTNAGVYITGSSTIANNLRIDGNVDLTGDLVLDTTGDYLVTLDEYAFRFDLNENYGQKFHANGFAYTDSSANTVWNFDPNNKVSSTTNGRFSGNVGIGVGSPTDALEVAGWTEHTAYSDETAFTLYGLNNFTHYFEPTADTLAVPAVVNISNVVNAPHDIIGNFSTGAVGHPIGLLATHFGNSSTTSELDIAIEARFDVLSPNYVSKRSYGVVSSISGNAGRIDDFSAFYVPNFGSAAGDTGEFHSLRSSEPRASMLHAGIIGIGNEDPDYGLEVSTTTSNGYFAVSDGWTGDGDIFKIDDEMNTIVGNELTVIGTSTLATTTMSFGSKIGSDAKYIEIEETDLGIFGSIPTLNPYGASGGGASAGVMGIHGGLLVFENDDVDDANPSIVLASRDAGSTANITSIEYATTTGILKFYDANVYDFDNDVEIDGKLDLNDGGGSVFIGENAGRIDDGSDNRNVGIGINSLYNNTSGGNNMAIGYYALRNNTTGHSNAAIGYASLYKNTTGEYNTTNGAFSMYGNITGSNNTVIGSQALSRNTSATSTTAIGYQAGRGTADYSNQNSTYIGYNAGYSAGNDSDNNVFLGYQAGYDTTTGADNIVIGYDEETTSATASGELNIGGAIYGIDLTGTPLIGIGTASPATPLEVEGATATGNYLMTLEQNTAGGEFLQMLEPDTNATSFDFKLDGDNDAIMIINDQAGDAQIILKSAGDSYFNGGNIGIGTSTPWDGYKLAVAGDIVITGEIAQNGTNYDNPAYVLDCYFENNCKDYTWITLDEQIKYTKENKEMKGMPDITGIYVIEERLTMITEKLEEFLIYISELTSKVEMALGWANDNETRIELLEAENEALKTRLDKLEELIIIK